MIKCKLLNSEVFRLAFSSTVWRSCWGQCQRSIQGQSFSVSVSEEFLTSFEKQCNAVSSHWLQTDCIFSWALVFWSVFVLYCGFKYDYVQFILQPHRFFCLFLLFCIKICCRCLIANGNIMQYVTYHLDKFILTHSGIQASMFNPSNSVIILNVPSLKSHWLMTLKLPAMTSAVKYQL